MLESKWETVEAELHIELHIGNELLYKPIEQKKKEKKERKMGPTVAYKSMV